MEASWKQMWETLELWSRKANVFVFNLFQWNRFAFISCEHISPFKFIPVAFLLNSLVNQVLAIGVCNVMYTFVGKAVDDWQKHQVHNLSNSVDGLAFSLLFINLLCIDCSYCVIPAITTIFVWITGHLLWNRFYSLRSLGIAIYFVTASCGTLLLYVSLLWQLWWGNASKTEEKCWLSEELFCNISFCCFFNNKASGIAQCKAWYSTNFAVSYDIIMLLC